MCLLFKQTTQLFWKWLYYGLSTMFATAMLAVVSDIAMDLVENISGALFVSDLFTNLLGSAALSGNTAGIMQASMQQLGLGLILSTLLISTPPMAAQFFNGVMGQFSTINALDRFASVPTCWVQRHCRAIPQGSCRHRCNNSDWDSSSQPYSSAPHRWRHSSLMG